MKWKNIENKYIPRLEVLEQKTSYELLEVETNVTLPDLKKAYRKMIKTYHPDCADGFMKEYTQEVTKLLNKAYQDLLKKTS